MTDEQIEELMSLRLDTAFNICYCGALAKRYQWWHSIGMSFVAVFTSTTVLSWLVSIDWTSSSKALSVIAAGVALVLPILKLEDKSRRMLATYAEWLVKQREEGWHVADLHSEMRTKVDEAKRQEPGFTVHKDRIHPNGEGHWMMAQCLIAYFGDPASAQFTSAKELLNGSKRDAIRQRMRSYQQAIHAETKPLRPNVPQGGTLESAAAKAKQLEEHIYQ